MRRGNAFGRVCLSVCLSVLFGLTFENFELETSFFVCMYIFRTSRSRLWSQGYGVEFKVIWSLTKYRHLRGSALQLKDDLVWFVLATMHGPTSRILEYLNAHEIVSDAPYFNPFNKFFDPDSWRCILKWCVLGSLTNCPNTPEINPFRRLYCTLYGKAKWFDINQWRHYRMQTSVRIYTESILHACMKACSNRGGEEDR